LHHALSLRATPLCALKEDIRDNEVERSESYNNIIRN
jgi:hypothetical protein